MAGARAATSLSMTIGVAAATLLVMGGILAGPAILDCAKDGSKFGACLRDKVAESGLIAPEGETVEKQLLTSEVSSSEPLPTPPVVAELPRPAGWLEANANEYEPRPPALAVLSGVPGKLFAGGEAPQNGPAVEVALVQPHGLLSASVSDAVHTDSATAVITLRTGDLLAKGSATAAPDAPVDVALAAPAGRLTASGSDAADLDSAFATLTLHTGDLLANGKAAAELAAPTEIALAAPTGRLSATGQGAAEPDTAIVAIVERPGDMRASGAAAIERKSPSIDVALIGPVGELTASMAVLAPPAAPASLTLLPRSGALTVLGTSGASVTIEANVNPERFSLGVPLATGGIGTAPDAPASVSLEASVASPAAQPMPEPPKPVIAFNPAFPNVLVLPPPNSGEDSSFRTLELN